MPTRATPTVRQQRLGAELRKMRTAANATTDHAGRLLGLDRTKVSNMEAGTRATSPERVRLLAGNYACTDERYIDALAEMAGHRTRGWWEQYRGSLPQGLLDVAELEWHATRLRTVQTVHLPGLLHLSGYARAVFSSAIPALPTSEVELRLAHRMQRQRILERDAPVPYTGYVHELALRMQFGGRRATREQLEHLCVMSERDHITLRVLPVAVGEFPGAGHAVMYAHGQVPQLDTVQLDSAHGPEFSHDPDQLAKYNAHMNWMDEHTLDTQASRDLIHTIAREL
ncbi:helix-turn-helix domain-containing protein [Streptomyces sp. NPDC085524]|uniref:helix-turn-helix domain-containing protein n=1 Tax=unclassified Streptomyces TaxID=2593676 RepID=UPI0035DE0D7F